MTPERPQLAATFGYLSTVHSTEHGYFGGYLILSALGRPLEFHCTAPVRPNRAQEILYGPTLGPYLLGEQIGGTLLHKAKLVPRLIITDQAATLCLRGQTACPIVQILSRQVESTGDGVRDDADSHSIPASDVTLSVGTGGGAIVVAGYQLEFPYGYEADQSAVVELLTQLAERVELAEPFERIHEAIREAQRIGEGGADDADLQAA